MITLRIEVIGEEVKKVEKRLGMEFLNLRPEIPWKEIMGMRNHIAHGYFDINELYVFSVIKNDLAPLLKAVEYLISMIETMRIEKDSYYTHQVMWNSWVDVQHKASHIIGHWNYEKGVKNVNFAGTVELFVLGITSAFGNFK